MVIHSISLKLTSKLTDVEMHEVHLIMTEMEIDELQVWDFNKSTLFSYCPIYSKTVLFIAVTVPHILLVLYQELELEHDDDSTANILTCVLVLPST